MILAPLFGLLAAHPATAQTSSSYKLGEASINSGGNPGNSGALASTHYRVSLDAIGDGVVRAGLASAAFHLDAGFVGEFPPPGEVTGLRFGDATTLLWSPERSAHRYEIYRGTISTLPGTFGTCFANDLSLVTATDASIPGSGQGFFYLVTSHNRLGEEGPKGFASNGTQEGNPLPCP
ncbi:MAG TPA: hypothetical protein VFQ07_08300 [Candidatus Polarisedimenticolia bacterium]|nr:hypothetical protein [Candidatus Polarisedimenticolia bacterium]